MQPSNNRSTLTNFRLDTIAGWIVTGIVCGLPVLMWMQIHPLGSLHGGLADVLLSTGQLTGLVGLVMYALNLVYATRLRFLERLFGGLNRVYIAHHILGGLALLFLAFHPMLLALRYATFSLYEAAMLLLPNGLTPLSALFNSSADAHQLVLDQWAVFFGIIAFWGMVVLLVITFFVKLPYKIWLFTHKFLGVAFFFAGLHVLFIASDVSRHAMIRYYILGWTVLGILAFVYRTLLGRILIRRYTYRVKDAAIEGGNVTQLLMEPAGTLKMSYKPGQFVFIRFLDGSSYGVGTEWHPFSISSSPGDKQLRISVKALGDFTNALANITQGAIAEIEGAYGRFTYTNYRNKKQIWVAGGIGITPFLSMAKSITPNDGYDIDLYYSVKSTSELIDWDTLKNIEITQKGNQKGSFRVIPFVAETQGFLTVDYIAKQSKGLDGKDVFMCGPPPMMKSLRKQLKAQGVVGSRVHTEEFSMS